jgi:ceramide glucosyltransferase
MRWKAGTFTSDAAADATRTSERETVTVVLACILLAAGCGGCLFMVLAAAMARSFTRRTTRDGGPMPAVTVLKPLYGDEPGLFESLATFCRQDYPGPVQLVCGVTNPNDGAIAIVTRLKAAFPQHAIELVVQPAGRGANPKVANLVNMSAHMAHDIVVIADSDIHVRSDYLRVVVGALLAQGSGAVTCPYYGVTRGGIWSRLSTLNVDGYFLPGVMLAVRLKLSQPCFGSTIALSARSLRTIGGFEALADSLADDYALGAALVKRQEPVTVLPFAVGHVCSETSLGDLWRHEKRWAATVRAVDAVGYVGWSVTHAFPLALVALGLGGGWPAVALASAALACRGALLVAIERAYGLPAHSYWLIPLRDLLSGAVFVAGLVARDVRWRQQRYRLKSEGTLMPERRSPSP